MDPHVCEHILKGLFQRGDEEVLPRREIAKTIDDECARGAQDAAHFGKSLAGHEVGWGGFTKEGVEHNGVVLLPTLRDEVTAIANNEMEFFGCQAKVFLAQRDHVRINFDDINFDVFACELHRDNADTQANTEHLLKVGCVGLGQVMEHVGEHRCALLPISVVGVLGEVVVQIEEITGSRLHDLQQTEIRIGTIEFNQVFISVALRGPAEITSEAAKQKAGGNSNFLDLGPARKIEVRGGEGEQSKGGDNHGAGVGEQGNENIAYEHGTDNAAEGANRRKPSDVPAYAGQRYGYEADQEGAGHREQGKRNEKENRGREETSQGETEADVESPIGKGFNNQDGQAQVGTGGEDAAIKPADAGGAVGFPATEEVADGKGDESDCNLGGPDEVGGADIRGEHLGAEDFDDHDGGAVDGGGQIIETPLGDGDAYGRGRRR